jgi:hypothetical protein
MMYFAQVDSRHIDGHGGDHKADGHIGQHKRYKYGTGTDIAMLVSSHTHASPLRHNVREISCDRTKIYEHSVHVRPV